MVEGCWVVLSMRPKPFLTKFFSMMKLGSSAEGSVGLKTQLATRESALTLNFMTKVGTSQDDVNFFMPFNLAKPGIAF